MPYSTQAIKITFGGALPGSEVWQCGLWVVPNATGGSQAALQNYANSLATPLLAWFNNANIASCMGGNVTINNVNAYFYLPGSGVASQVAHGVITPASQASPIGGPNQLALVASLRTVDPSRKGRGRIYIPACGANITTGNQVIGARATGVATATAALLTAINGLQYASQACVVVGGTSGFPVTNVIVDSVMDTQRRRRNKTLPATTGNASV